MSSWKKFRVVLYCSTILAAIAIVGFALFIGATPSGINLFDKNHDVRKWVFIAAAVSLAYITLSAFIMFCVLTTTKKPVSDSKYISGEVSEEADLTISDSQKKNEITNSSNPLLQYHSVTNSSFVGSTADSQQLKNKNYSNLQDTEQDIKKMNKEYHNVDIPSDYLRSDYSGSAPSSRQYLDQKDNHMPSFIPMRTSYRPWSNELKEINESWERRSQYQQFKHIKENISF